MVYCKTETNLWPPRPGIWECSTNKGMAAKLPRCSSAGFPHGGALHLRCWTDGLGIHDITAPKGLDPQVSLSIQSQTRPLGMLPREAGLSANARFLICEMRDNLKLLRMAVHSLFWRDDWQSNVVDVFRTEVDVVLAGQFLFRSKKSVTFERNFGCCRLHRLTCHLAQYA